MVTIEYGFSISPFGEIIVAATDNGICDLQFLDHNKLETIHELGRRWGVYTPTTQSNDMAQRVQRVVFEGLGRQLTVDLRGTDFQIQVWREVQRVPFGQTASYQDIADRIGNPQAVRAVASAIAQNPVAMLIPCHRIVHSDGTPGEYHWGRDLKQQLLQWEAARAAAATAQGGLAAGWPAIAINSSTTPLAQELSEATLSPLDLMYLDDEA